MKGRSVMIVVSFGKGCRCRHEPVRTGMGKPVGSRQQFHYLFLGGGNNFLFMPPIHLKGTSKNLAVQPDPVRIAGVGGIIRSF